jgi:hypothetical protein
MKHRSIPALVAIALLVLFAAPLWAQKPAETPAVKDNSVYRQYADRVKKGDTDFHFGLFRKAYVEWVSGQEDADDTQSRKDMVKAFEAKNYAKAVELAEVVVQDEYLNRGLIGAIEDAHRKLGNTAKADFYKELGLKVGHSLMLSGDGKTTKTAFYVFSIPEEYKIMREFGYTVSMQSLVSENGQRFDVLAGADEKGNKVSLYFNICYFYGGCSFK